MTALFMRTRGNALVAGIVPHFVINGLGATGAWATRPAEAVALATVGLIFVVTAAGARSFGDRRSARRAPSRRKPPAQ